MEAETERPLRISDLERISGIGRSTIHYYLREGLLPPPKKTGKTMAYYDVGHVRQLKEIKKLQDEGYPISYIKEMLVPAGPEERDIVEDVGDVAKSDRRRQIIDKAVEIFARKGYHQTSVVEITRAVGVGHSTFYIYFPNKMALFTECVEDVFQAMFAGVWEEIKGEKNPVARLNKRAEVVLKSHPQFIDMMNVLKSIEEQDPTLEAKKRDIYFSIVETVKRDVRRAIEMDLIQEIDVDVASFYLVGFLESTWLLMNMDKSYTVEQLLDVLTAMFAPSQRAGR